MELPRPGGQDRQFSGSLIPGDPSAGVRPVFGSLGACGNGTMLAGLLGPDAGVRPGQSGAGELSAIEGAGPFGPAGRPVSGYLTLPGARRSTPELASHRAERALAHVRAMPPRMNKPRPAKSR